MVLQEQELQRKASKVKAADQELRRLTEDFEAAKNELQPLKEPLGWIKRGENTC